MASFAMIDAALVNSGLSFPASPERDSLGAGNSLQPFSRNETIVSHAADTASGVPKESA